MRGSLILEFCAADPDEARRLLAEQATRTRDPERRAYVEALIDVACPRSRAEDRYLRLVRWAARRYRENGLLALERGGRPSAYTRIERAAWRRYVADNMEITSD